MTGTAANDLNFTGEYTVNGNRVSILYQFNQPLGVLVDGSISMPGTKAQQEEEDRLTTQDQADRNAATLISDSDSKGFEDAAKNLGRDADQWERLAEQYLGDDSCDAARAYERAALDYALQSELLAKAGKFGESADQLIVAEYFFRGAAYHYELCGDGAIEKGDYVDGLSSYAKAETVYWTVRQAEKKRQSEAETNAVLAEFAGSDPDAAAFAHISEDAEELAENARREAERIKRKREDARRKLEQVSHFRFGLYMVGVV